MNPDHWLNPRITEALMDEGVRMEGGPANFNDLQQQFSDMDVVAGTGLVWNFPDEEE
jgi:hypothetical protein